MRFKGGGQLAAGVCMYRRQTSEGCLQADLTSELILATEDLNVIYEVALMLFFSKINSPSANIWLDWM